MRIILAITFLILSVLGFAQDFHYTNYSIADGLAQSQVIALAIDDKEQVWAGTNGGGISVYNGVSFTTFNKENGLTSNYIYSLFKDSKDNIWIGTNNGVTFYNNKSFYQYTSLFSEKDIVHSIAEAQNGDVFFGTNFGLKKFVNGGIQNIITNSIIDSTKINKIFIDKENNIWLGTQGEGVIKYNGIGIKQFNTSDALPHNTVRVVFQDNMGNIVVGTDKGACYISANDKVVLPKDKRIATYTAGLLSDNNKVVIITYTGWYISGSIENGEVVYDARVEFPIKYFRQIVQDKEGSFWIGHKNGLIKFDSNIKFVNYFNNKNSKESLNSFAVNVNDSNIYIGDYAKGIRVIKNTKDRLRKNVEYKLYSYPDYIIGQRVFSLMSKNENLWVSTWSGISTVNIETEKSKSYSSIPITAAIRELLPVEFSPRTNTSVLLPDSSIWFGTKKGIIVYENDKFSLLSDLNENFSVLKNIEILKFQIDGNFIWASTKNGIIKISKNNIEEYGAREGFVDTQVNSFVIDYKNNLWLSSREGLYFYDRNSFVNISSEFGLDFGSIYLIEKDDYNNLYIGTNKGLDKFSLKEFYKNNTVSVNHYGKAEGFLGVECNRNASFKDKEGNLWFGTVNGVVKYNPTKDIVNNIEPNTYIENLMLNMGKDSLSDYCEGITDNNLPNNLELEYNKTHITFHFFGTSKKNLSKVKFQYKLIPLNDDWVPVSNRIADFPILPDGDYTFMVRSCNNDGLWDETPAEFSFVVKPPFWKAIWFILLVIISGVLIVYLYIKQREKALKKEKEVLENKVTERTKELVKQKEIVEEKNKDITDSINYAKNIQQAILPSEDDFKNSFEKSLIVYKPRDIVSGDFYWLSTKNKRTFVTAADSTGHGVPGAFMSMLGMAFLEQIVSDNSGINAAQVLFKMRENVMKSLKQGEHGKSRDGMDMAMSVIDRNENVLNFSGANNPLYIISKDSSKLDVANGVENVIEPIINGEGNKNLFEIKPDKMPIGYYIKNDEFTNHKLDIVKGDIIYMFSDGYADQFGGEKGKKFKYKKFKNLLLSLSELPIEKQQKEIDSVFEEWKKGYEQLDDIIVVGIIL